MCNITYKLNPSEEPDLTDDEIEVFVDGKKMPFAIQLAGRAFCVNEYPEDGEDEDFWVKEHQVCRSLAAAKLEVTDLVKAHLAK